MTPEFSRCFPIDTIGAARTISIEAGEREREALAKRFDLISIDALSATAQLLARAGGVSAEGTLSAQVRQQCVVTGDPVPAAIDQPFSLLFLDPAALRTEAEEIELSDGDCDILPLEDGAVDLGEAAAQTLALALDPFPRSPTADVPQDGIWRAGEDAGPFAALKGLIVPKAGEAR